MDTPIVRAEYTEFTRRVEDENDRQNHRLAVLEEAVRQSNALIANVERLAANMENMLKEQERQGKRLEALERRDGEMWRKIVGYLATTVAGLLLGLAARSIGM